VTRYVEPLGIGQHEFAPADELPHPVDTSDPRWSESFLVQAFSPDSGVGFFAHNNRCQFDPNLWSDVIAVYLPGDRFAVAKGFGYSSNSAQVGGCLAFEVLAPFVTHITKFRGAGQLLDGAVLRKGPAPSGMHIGLDVDLTYTALGPPFGVGDLKPGALGHTHYEQHLSVQGHITVDGVRTAIDGTGFRDHTWGPRDLSVMGNHHWMHGQFPSGKWFSTMVVSRRGGGQPLLDFHLIGDQAGTTRASRLSPPPLLAEESEVWNPWEVQLQTGDGVEVIRGEILAPMPFSFVGPVEMTLGIDRGPNASHAIYESQSRLTWNGETGFGLCERSVARPERKPIS
jgi:hypothetical protein